MTIDLRHPGGLPWDVFLKALEDFQPIVETDHFEPDSGFPPVMTTTFSISGVEPYSKDVYGGYSVRYRYITANSLVGIATEHISAYKDNCRKCNVVMVRSPQRRHCVDCSKTIQRELNAEAAKRYRLREGITKPNPPKACAHCGETFQPKRSSAKFCSDRCRLLAHRAKR